MIRLSKEARRGIQATKEAMWTPLEAAWWAAGQERLSRRFRVEGSAVGNSRLLRRADAERLAERHGGRVVELIAARDKRAVRGAP